MDVEEGQIREFGKAKEHEPRFFAGPIAVPAGQVLSMAASLRTRDGSLAGLTGVSLPVCAVVDLKLLD
jgi:hypothetical protein